MSLPVAKIEPLRTRSSRSSLGVDQVAVVGDGDLAVRAVDQERLRVLQLALARGGVAGVADGKMAGQLLQRASR